VVLLSLARTWLGAAQPIRLGNSGSSWAAARIPGWMLELLSHSKAATVLCQEFQGITCCSSSSRAPMAA